jgi:hypothetical protein
MGALEGYKAVNHLLEVDICQHYQPLDTTLLPRLNQPGTVQTLFDSQTALDFVVKYVCF